MNAKRIATGCGVTILAAAVGIAWFFWSYHRQHVAHARLRLGMTRPQVEKVFGRPPDWEVGIGAASVLVFLDRWQGVPCVPGAARYETPRELPWCYSAVQVALARTGGVSAFVHVGEGGVTSRRPMQAATLADAPLDALE